MSPTTELLLFIEKELAVLGVPFYFSRPNEAETMVPLIIVDETFSYDSSIKDRNMSRNTIPIHIFEKVGNRQLVEDSLYEIKRLFQRHSFVFESGTTVNMARVNTSTITDDSTTITLSHGIAEVEFNITERVKY
ncbi:hypothetical protein HB943_02235 [Listeria weihenstephanensis]|uniref:Phage protein n=1 Tax=Listeria weihenstephanensis TaxID=1006155 RepID=A0A841Z2G2_9LIST|nr:hypothetical protein [Listeria weihenstephanensis]MBC1499405.1 hypothetical protein [Listeria weihenstephanensis]